MIIYRYKEGYKIFTDFSKRIVLNNSNIENFLNNITKKKFKREQEEKQREKFRKFFHGFFGFDESPDEPEKKDNDYPYSVFGLTKSASDEDVKKAYRKSILKAHPDKGGTAELFRKVREAWDYFSSFSSRAAAT